MGGTDPAVIEEAHADLTTLLARISSLDYTGLGVRELLELQSRRERLRCAAEAVDHRILAALAAQATPKEIGAKSWAEVQRIRLHISAEEARRRVRDMENLGPRTGLTGEPLPPLWEEAARAQAAGAINGEHITVIGHFMAHLPAWVDPTTRTQCEQSLVAGAQHQTPEELRAAANQLRYLLDQDGPLPDDAERARKRSFRIGKQQPDGMSKVDGWLDPEARATLEAVQAKLGAPGMCNPADDVPCRSGTPSQAQIDNDTRSAEQRNHDALVAMGRIALGTDLGDHNGLPVTVVVTTTMQELEHGAGLALTHTGSKLPIPDLIRMAAAGAHHYLLVFDKHTNVPLYLGRARRTASVGQRLALFGRDHGCTRPNCPQPASRSQAHHAVSNWRDDGQTDITDMALACGCDNRAADTGGWTTTMKNGRAHWTPPPLLDVGQPRTNQYHHPTLYPPERGDNDGETDSPAS
ncbi:hypothetical protein BOO86_27980 [Mycobacterium sp. CBMA 234]|uniref:DUF222 domain-containing protein n=1 Tax=Mycolicibacterium sp. CBMA 234 TaxID=1918495 RepID=UPI0012DD35D9|nr:DUF222 domain-containing protein [Mycolicibacterium sp. CBMA 234]MUL68339.1 hypothetical protein [Mycolicibacterium sp. CBMA 234]